MIPVSYDQNEMRQHYGRCLVAAHKAKSADAKAKAVVEASSAARLVERGGVVDHDIANVAKIEKALNVVAADKKNPADKRMEQLDREYSEHLLNRLASAIKSINTGGVKQLERAVINCETLLQSQPATNGIVEYLKKVSAKTKSIKQAHVQAQEDAARLKHAKEALARADENLFTKTIKELLQKG